MGPVPNPDDQRDHPNHNGGSDIEDAEHPDVIINVEITDSDSYSDDDEDDDIQGGYMGYQALTQDVGAVGNDIDSDEEFQNEEVVQTDYVESGMDSEASGIEVPDGLLHQIRHTGPEFPNTTNVPGYMQVPEVPRPEKKDLLWNQTRHVDSTLDTGHAEKIKSLMSGIQLPPTNIPDWARNLSEEQWQAQVVNKLTSLGTRPQQEVVQGTNRTADKTESSNEKLTVTESASEHCIVNSLHSDSLDPH